MAERGLFFSDFILHGKKGSVRPCSAKQAW